MNGTSGKRLRSTRRKGLEMERVKGRDGEERIVGRGGTKVRRVVFYYVTTKLSLRPQVAVTRDWGVEGKRSEEETGIKD
jgi:hypothetical protein